MPTEGFQRSVVLKAEGGNNRSKAKEKDPLKSLLKAMGVKKSAGTKKVEAIAKTDQLRLRSPQLASPPSDTSRDSQFESASSKCEPPPRGWFIGRFMATGVGLLAKQWSLLGVSN